MTTEAISSRDAKKTVNSTDERAREIAKEMANWECTQEDKSKMKEGNGGHKDVA